MSIILLNKIYKLTILVEIPNFWLKNSHDLLTILFIIENVEKVITT